MFLGYIVLQLFYSYIIIIIIIISSSSSSSSSSSCCYNHLLCIVFTIMYLKQTMFVGYIVLQLFSSYIIIIIIIIIIINVIKELLELLLPLKSHLLVEQKQLRYKFSILYHISLNKEMYASYSFV
jgi:hypothetical protein